MKCRVLLNLLVTGFLFLGTLATTPLFAKVPDQIRFGVLSIAQPARIHAQWQPFIDYLSNKLNKKIELVIPRGFKKIKSAAEEGSIDLFYINSHVFYRLLKSGKASPLAQMENLGGNTMSNSVIVVRKDSHMTNIQQLRGETIAFVSPMGAGGYLAPRALFYKNGVATKSQLNEVFTKNLSTSLHKVIRGDVAAAVMCGLNYKLLSKKIDTGELKIILESDDYPENLIAANSNLSDELKGIFERVILSMPNDPDGRTVLAKMQSAKIKRFVPYDNNIESVLENLLQDAKMQ